MSAIKFFMKDGSVKDFPETYRAGGSWSNTLRGEGPFAVVTNAHGEETWVPAEDINEIKTTPNRGAW